MAKYDTTELVALMQRRGLVPANQGTFSTAEFLLDASAQLEAGFIPLLVQANKDYGVYAKDYAITAGQARYDVPSRSSMMGLRDIFVVATDGTVGPALVERKPEELSRLGLNTLTTGEPEFYYLEHNEIVLYPIPSATTGTLRVKYCMKPSRMVLPATVAIIATKPSVNSVTVAAANGIVSTNVVDIVRAVPGFDLLDQDLTVTVAAGPPITFTFSASYSSRVAVGDQVCLARESAVPQIPAEFHLPLALVGIGPHLRALGNKKLADDLRDEAKELVVGILGAVSPRNRGATPDIASYDWFG